MVLLLNTLPFALRALRTRCRPEKTLILLLILFASQVTAAVPKNYYNSYQSYVYKQAQQCPNGICIKPLYGQKNAFGSEEVGPVFVGGSFDFDLAQLAHLIGPMYNLLKNSEIIKIGTERNDNSKEPAKESESVPQPVVSLGMPEVHFVNPQVPMRPLRRPDMYQMSDSQLSFLRMKPFRRKSKRKKKPSKSGIPPLITIVDDDDEDVKKNSNEEEEEEDGGEKDDKTDLEKLLESGLSGIIMDDLLGLGRTLLRPGRILTQLAVGTIARRMMKRVFRSMFMGLLPRRTAM